MPGMPGKGTRKGGTMTEGKAGIVAVGWGTACGNCCDTACGNCCGTVCGNCCGTAAGRLCGMGCGTACTGVTVAVTVDALTDGGLDEVTVDVRS